MTDAEIVAHAVELKKAVERVNVVVAQLTVAGARVDLTVLDHRVVPLPHPVPVVTVDVYRRVVE